MGVNNNNNICLMLILWNVPTQHEFCIFYLIISVLFWSLFEFKLKHHLLPWWRADECFVKTRIRSVWLINKWWVHVLIISIDPVCLLCAPPAVLRMNCSAASSLCSRVKPLQVITSTPEDGRRPFRIRCQLTSWSRSVILFQLHEKN